MASAKILEIVKRGRPAILKYRTANPGVLLDLVDADLSKLNLQGAPLYKADLIGAKLKGTKLGKSDLRGCDLTRADLENADLRKADLRKANFSRANLQGADLSGAQLEGANMNAADFTNAKGIGTDFSLAQLTRTILTNCDFTQAIFNGANLSAATFQESILNEASLTETLLIDTQFKKSSLIGTNFSRALIDKTHWQDCTLAWATFGNVNLGTASGLDSFMHLAPSCIGIDTLYRSNGKISESFLQACGLPEAFLDTWPKFKDTNDPVQSHVFFIRFGEKDRVFAEQLQLGLTKRGLRCWLNDKSENSEDTTEPQYFRSEHLWEKIIFCASSHSLGAPWGEQEINMYFDKEKRYSKDQGKPVQAFVVVNLDGYLFGGNWKSPHVKEVGNRIVADYAGWRRSPQKFEEETDKVRAALIGENEKKKK
ncbi:MAG: pentapeptide repeat-containing protein [Planctomycetota bacterium]|nr:pentapeptide repeat-containing protein [Planctomycetota bacterium]MDA1213044.1 pentapeptide repeat-containing protein [Planctomycetota bacterium]